MTADPCCYAMDRNLGYHSPECEAPCVCGHSVDDHTNDIPFPCRLCDCGGCRVGEA